MQEKIDWRDDRIKILEAELANARANYERLQTNLDWWFDACQEAWRERDDAHAVIDNALKLVGIMGDIIERLTDATN